MEGIIEITPGYDKRSDDPNKNYGIHGINLRMVLKGKLGATQFLVYTNRFPKYLIEEQIARDEITDPVFIKGLLEYTGPFPEGKIFQEITRYQLFLNGFHNIKHKFLYEPMAADLGYHSPKPTHDDDEPIGSKDYKIDWKINEKGEKVSDVIVVPTGTFRPCEYLDGRACYYDGSSLNAIPVYDLMVKYGEKAVWKKLEEYYIQTFDVLL